MSAAANPEGPDHLTPMRRPGPPSTPPWEDLEGTARWHAARSEYTSTITSYQREITAARTDFRHWRCPGTATVDVLGDVTCTSCTGHRTHRPSALWWCSEPAGPWCACPHCRTLPDDVTAIRFLERSATTWPPNAVLTLLSWFAARTPDAATLALDLVAPNAEGPACTGTVGVSADGWWCTDPTCGRTRPGAHAPASVHLCRGEFHTIPEPTVCPCPWHGDAKDRRAMWQPPGLAHSPN